MAIIFNSEIWHHTPVNCSKYTRVSISGNLVATKKMVEILENDDDCLNPYWKYAGKNDVQSWISAKKFVYLRVK